MTSVGLTTGQLSTVTWDPPVTGKGNKERRPYDQGLLTTWNPKQPVLNGCLVKPPFFM